MLSSRPLFNEAFKVVILSDHTLGTVSAHSGSQKHTKWRPSCVEGLTLSVMGFTVLARHDKRKNE